LTESSELEEVEWTAARELSEETLGLLGGTVEGGGVKTIYTRLLDVRRTKGAISDPDSQCGFLAFLVRLPELQDP